MNDYEVIVKEEQQRVNDALAKYLDSKIEQVSRLGDWHTKYYANIREYIMRGGKRLRPILVAIGYKAIREDVDIQHLYRAACSVEILHNGSLLHDDLIDHDETRRGGKTFHATYRDWYKTHSENMEKAQDFGMTMAILGGDSLLNMGAESISQSHLAPEIEVKCQNLYQTAFQYLADGVMLEMTMMNQKDTSPETYLEMVAMKTAVLFEKSLLMGANLASATESQLNALQEYGIKVGQAFQMQDDILGTFGDEEVTGKPADGDIREGKKTMLVIVSYKNANEEQQNLLDNLLGKDGMSDEEVEQVRQLFRDTGALKETEDLMMDLLRKGQNALEAAVPPLIERYKNFLLNLSQFLVERKY